MWKFNNIDDNHALGYSGHKIEASKENENGSRDVVFFLFNKVALNASKSTIDLSESTINVSEDTINKIIETLKSQSEDVPELMDKIFKISSLNNNDPDHHPKLLISTHLSSGLDSLLKKILQEPTLYKPESV